MHNLAMYNNQITFQIGTAHTIIAKFGEYWRMLENLCSSKAFANPAKEPIEGDRTSQKR